MGSSEVTVLGVGRACTHIRMQSFYVLAALLGVTACMDVGRSGVYDSPLATDYYVRQFGFMFGGGRSGLQGLKAMQESQNYYHTYHFPSYPRNYKEINTGKKMVELEPLMVDNHVTKPQMFH